MKEMRSKVELLKLLLEYFERGDPQRQTSLCQEVGDMLYRGALTNEERKELKTLIKRNAPSDLKPGRFFWLAVNQDPSAKQIRIDFLKQLIEKYNEDKSYN